MIHVLFLFSSFFIAFGILILTEYMTYRTPFKKSVRLIWGSYKWFVLIGAILMFILSEDVYQFIMTNGQNMG